ncbi:hypothetical protein SB783_37575 [Paraburkholderia sp. SIMBA_009]
MTHRNSAIRAGAFALLCLPAIAFAQSTAFESPADTLNMVLLNVLPIMALVGITAFALVSVLGAEALGTLLLGALAIVFFPITLIVLGWSRAMKLREKRLADAARRERIEAELATRAEFDDWLTEAALRAEIAACVDPSNAAACAELDRLQAAKRANGARLVELHDRPDMAEVTPSTVEAVKGQWAALQQA